jgi:hypothetical protein
MMVPRRDKTFPTNDCSKLELGFSDEQAMKEDRRCLQCDLEIRQARK